MATSIEAARHTVASRASAPHAPQFLLARLLLPMLVVAAGISLGTFTGLAFALVNASRGDPAASSESIQDSSTTAQAGTSLAVNTPPAPTIQTAVFTPQNANPSQPDAITGPSVARAEELRGSAENPAVKAHPRPAAHRVHRRKQAMLRAATFKPAGEGKRGGRHRLTSAQLAAPAALDGAQLSLDEARPSIFYTEGDLTVEDYDATSGTIHASDGRTFILGETVAASYATSWDDYRSGVHYRCGQNGICMLMRAGVVAPNARLI